MNDHANIIATADKFAAHDAAITVANRAVASLDAEIDTLTSGNPNGYAAWRAGRYYWPTLDRLHERRRDAWIEAALRAGADPDKIGPRADVEHFQRKIAGMIGTRTPC